MRKMTVVILTAALAAAIMAGCSGGSDNSSSTTSTNSTTSSASNSSTTSDSKEAESKEVSSDTSKSESTASETSEESSEPESTESKSEASNSGESSKEKVAAFTYNNVEIKIDMEVSPLLEKLGEPDYKATIEANEENSEESYSYTYDNMTIYAYLKDKKQYVADVSISGPGSATTANGITVGASKDDVAKVYGEISDEAMASYEIGTNIIMFIFEDDCVTDISLGRGLSDEEL